MFTEKREQELWTKYRKEKSLEAKEELILNYVGLVKYIAGRMAINMPPNITYDDLYSYGIFGLMDAIDKFDPKRGVKFKTYAMSRIRGAILDELRANDWIPRSLRQKAKQVEKAIAEIEMSKGRAATDEEISKYLGMSLEEYNALISELNSTTILSLDEIIHIGGEDDEVNLKDVVENQLSVTPTDEIEFDELKSIIKDAIKELPKKEQEVIYLYYYEELTLKEIGEVLNISESRVSQIHTKAILKLRSKITSQTIPNK